MDADGVSVVFPSLEVHPVTNGRVPLPGATFENRFEKFPLRTGIPFVPVKFNAAEDGDGVPPVLSDQRREARLDPAEERPEGQVRSFEGTPLKGGGNPGHVRNLAAAGRKRFAPIPV